MASLTKVMLMWIQNFFPIYGGFWYFYVYFCVKNENESCKYHTYPSDNFVVGFIGKSLYIYHIYFLSVSNKCFFWIPEFFVSITEKSSSKQSLKDFSYMHWTLQIFWDFSAFHNVVFFIFDRNITHLQTDDNSLRY